MCSEQKELYWGQETCDKEAVSRQGGEGESGIKR